MSPEQELELLLRAREACGAYIDAHALLVTLSTGRPDDRLRALIEAMERLGQAVRGASERPVERPART